MPCCLHFLAETPLSFSLAEKEKWQKGKPWSLKFTLNMYVDLWISSSFLASCLSSSCLTVSPRQGQWGEPRVLWVPSEICPQPTRICCAEGKGSACSPVSSHLQMPWPTAWTLVSLLFPQPTRGNCLPWHSHRGGCYDAVSLQPCIPGSSAKAISKRAAKNGWSQPEREAAVDSWLVTVCSTQDHLHTGRINFSLLSLYLLGPAIYRAFEKDYQF